MSPVPRFALTSTGWDELHLFTTGDPATNTIEGTIPMPPGTHWRIQAVAAVASTRAVMNVAFRGTGEAGTWFEDQQAAALPVGRHLAVRLHGRGRQAHGRRDRAREPGSRLLRARLHLRLHDRASTAARSSTTRRRGRELRRHPGPRRPGRGCVRAGASTSSAAISRTGSSCRARPRRTACSSRCTATRRTTPA